MRPVVLTPKELATRWRTCVETVHAIRKAGEIPAFSVSPSGSRKKHWRFTEAAVLAYEQRQANGEPPAPRSRTRRQRETSGVIEFFK